MKMNNGLREMLEHMSTTKLDDMLRAELQKRPPDATAVNLIMEVLEERDTGEPVEMNAEIQDAWEEYKNSTEALIVPGYAWGRGSMLLRVASVLVVIGVLLFAMPQEAGAKSLWDRFLFVTDSIFEFFNPGDANDHHVEYQFETGNPGLQQVYDAVVELGITDPVVPMWLPEGYELVELKKENTRTKSEIYTRFESSGYYMVLKIETYYKTATHDYFKDETNYLTMEYGGNIHNVMQNNEMLVAVWARDNVECSLTINSQEDMLYEILKSIYVMGDE